MRWKWALLLAVITLALAGVWALPYVFPDQDLGLSELNQLAGIASLAVAIAALFVGMWSLTERSGTPNNPPDTGTTNTIHGNVSGPAQVIQSGQVNLDSNTSGHGRNI